MRLADNPHLDDELMAIADQVMSFCEKEVKPFGEAWEREGRVPRDVLRKMGELIPKLKSRTEGKAPKPGTPGVPFPGYPETLMPIYQDPAQAALAMQGAAGGGSSKKKGKK